MLLVKKHALASSAAGGLRAAAECVQIALGHCSLLESRGLALCAVLSKLFWVSIEQALDYNLKQIEESTAADDWELVHPPPALQSAVASMASYQYKVSSSAHRFNIMVHEILFGFYTDHRNRLGH